jgi:IS30 family transposase
MGLQPQTWRGCYSPFWPIVLNGLRCNWSPELIAGKLLAANKLTNAGDQSAPTQAMTVSHETICCAIYAMHRGALRAELAACCVKATRSAPGFTKSRWFKSCLHRGCMICEEPEVVGLSICWRHVPAGFKQTLVVEPQCPHCNLASSAASLAFQCLRR